VKLTSVKEDKVRKLKIPHTDLGTDISLRTRKRMSVKEDKVRKLKNPH